MRAVTLQTLEHFISLGNQESDGWICLKNVAKALKTSAAGLGVIEQIIQDWVCNESTAVLSCSLWGHFSMQICPAEQILNLCVTTWFTCVCVRVCVAPCSSRTCVYKEPFSSWRPPRVSSDLKRHKNKHQTHFISPKIQPTVKEVFRLFTQVQIQECELFH